MKTYQVLYAEDVPHYAWGEVEARTPQAAIRKARRMNTASFWQFEPDWDRAFDKRIVHIEAPDGRLIAEDIQLDAEDAFVIVGDKDKVRAARSGEEFLQALEKIAAIPLWGEPIANADERQALADHGEYDLAENSFEPSCDTESSQLRDAVEIAREALKAYRGQA